MRADIAPDNIQFVVHNRVAGYRRIALPVNNLANVNIVREQGVQLRGYRPS
jgi:hypothetical protein